MFDYSVVRTDPRVVSMTAFDPPGSAEGLGLYVGGVFETIGGVTSPAIARWDGRQWATVGGGMAGGYSGLDPEVQAAAVFDDGTGPALYVTGNFTIAGGQEVQSIAKWDGTSWSDVGGGFDGGSTWVPALTVFDDGTGPALYVGGNFSSVGQIEANNIAKWDGAQWSPVGGGTDGGVGAFELFDDGTGLALYVGGGFDFCGEVTADGVAKWDGATWTPLGAGVPGLVWDMAVFDDGCGPRLYVGGRFTSAGSVSTNAIARWDGAEWSSLGAGLIDRTGPSVYALEVFDHGNGAALFVGGMFDVAGHEELRGLAKWDGQAWSAVAPEVYVGWVHGLAVFDPPFPGMGPRLVIGGGTFSVPGLGDYYAAQWNGETWSALGGGLGWPDDWGGLVLATLDTPVGGVAPGLYAGGAFESAGGVPLENIARWNGYQWVALGEGIGGGSDYVLALSAYDSPHAGASAGLYAGGSFVSAGGVLAANIAKWDGHGWLELGAGVDGSVRALAVFDPPGAALGPSLFVGGWFNTADGLLVNGLAVWDGNGWSAVDGWIDGRVHAFAVYDDGSGPALYVGGMFDAVADQEAYGLARWNGNSWSSVGGGVEPWAIVEALAVFDDGTGSALFVGGEFESAGGVPAHSIAKWDGSQWSRLPGDFGGSTWGARVLAMSVFDPSWSNAGPKLYVGGVFDTIGSLTVNNIAVWDGVQWSADSAGVGGSSSPSVSAIAVFDEGYGSALFVAGGFRTAGQVASMHIARWGCPLTAPVLGDMDFDGDVELDDYARLAACLTGPEVPTGIDCSLADVEGNGHVDLGDVAAFQRRFGGGG